jgi:hypothetical protein
MTSREFDTIATKLDLETRQGDHLFALLRHEGKVVIRTKRSHGNKDQPTHLIRKQLKVSEDQFRGLHQCWLSKDEYMTHLKEKGII